MREAGHDVLTATTVRQALASLLNSGYVDLLMTELALPHLSGVALIERLRLTAPALPIIVISAHIPPEARRTRVALTELGVLHVLGKPFSPTDLLDAVSLVPPEHQ